MDTTQRFKKIRQSLGLSQPDMSARVGLGRNAWQTYELGKSHPGTDVYAELIKLGFSANWIIAGIGSMYIDDCANHASGELPAGHDGWHAFFEESLRKDGDVSCLSLSVACCDSMSPTISMGDVLIVKNANGLIAGDGIYMLGTPDGSCVIKRMQWLFDGSYRMMSDNPAYPLQMICADELSCVHVIGKIVWHGKRV